MSVRISFTDEEFESLLWSVFTEDKISLDWNKEEDSHKQLSKKLQKVTDKHCFDDVIESIKEYRGMNTKDMFEEEDEEHIEMRKKDITDPKGIFHCPKCKLRTNQKTYQTRCVICDTSLQRVGVD